MTKKERGPGSRGWKSRKGTPSGPPAGIEQRNMMRDALMLELHEEAIVGKGRDARTFRKMRIVAHKLVNAAMAGDVRAIESIFERIDGKVKQVQVHEGNPDAPVQGEVRIHMVDPPRRKK